MYHCLLLLDARELVVFLYRSVFTFKKKIWGGTAPRPLPLLRHCISPSSMLSTVEVSIAFPKAAVTKTHRNPKLYPRPSNRYTRMSNYNGSLFSSFGRDLSLILNIGSVHLDRKTKVIVTHLNSYTVSSELWACAVIRREYRRTSTNGHLSKTATCLQWPLYSILKLKVAVEERFNTVESK